MKQLLLFLSLISIITVGTTTAEEKRSSSKKQGWLGVSIQDVTPRFARDHELKTKEGAFINEVVDESPADSAGIKKGDVITEFNGKKIETADDLTEAVRATAPGSKVTAKVLHKGDSKSITLNVGKLRNRSTFTWGDIPTRKIGSMMMRMLRRDREGIETMDLSKQLGEYFEVPGGKGVLVTSVEKEKNGAKAGIAAGDVIVKIGEDPVRSQEDVFDALSDSDEGDTVAVELYRKGKKLTVTLEISEDVPAHPQELRMRSFPRGSFHFETQPDMGRIQRELESHSRELERAQRMLERTKEL